MPTKFWAHLAALVIAGCSSKSPPPPPYKGGVVVVLTIDWEGAVLSPEGLDALDAVRKQIGDAPLTHFVSSAYFTKADPDPTVVHTLQQEIRKGDQLAVHVHAWRSLAKASGIEPKLAPSFLTGTDKLLEFEDGDVGFDTDLDAYSVADLRVLLRTSKHLLEQTHLPVSSAFRAGGYLSTPKVLQALRDEGYTTDSSAIDYRQLDEHVDDILPNRLKAIWPGVEPRSQPWKVQAPGGELLELPIAAVADYSTPQEIVGIFEAAHAQLQKVPTRDVFVVLGFHQETAAEFAGRLGDAIEKVRARPELASELTFATVDRAAQLAQTALASSSK